MKKNWKIVLCTILGIAIVLFSLFFYQVNLNYRFREVEKGKVYRSGVIPADKLPYYIQKYHIKSVIDLRKPGTKNTVDNPEKPTEMGAEKFTLEKLHVNYFNIPSDQTPNSETLSRFFTVMDNPNNYPVLIHCYHGVGRAGIYSAIYQIEYEKLSNEQARFNTCSLLELRPFQFSSFDNGKSKGEYLKKYQTRHHHLPSTAYLEK